MAAGLHSLTGGSNTLMPDVPSKIPRRDLAPKDTVDESRTGSFLHTVDWRAGTDDGPGPKPLTDRWVLVAPSMLLPTVSLSGTYRSWATVGMAPLTGTTARVFGFPAYLFSVISSWPAVVVEDTVYYFEMPPSASPSGQSWTTRRMHRLVLYPGLAPRLLYAPHTTRKGRISCFPCTRLG